MGGRGSQSVEQCMMGTLHIFHVAESRAHLLQEVLTQRPRMFTLALSDVSSPTGRRRNVIYHVT